MTNNNSFENRNFDPEMEEVSEGFQAPPGYANKSINTSKSGGAEALKNIGSRVIKDKAKIPGSSEGSIPLGGVGGETVEKAQRLTNSVKNIAKMSQKLASTVQSLVPTLFKIIINPITWIAIAVVLIGLWTYSYTLVIGKDMECIDGPSASGGALDWPGDDAELGDKENALMAWFTSTPFEKQGGQPMSKEQAAAFIANMRSETSTYNASLIQQTFGGQAKPSGDPPSNEAMLSFVSGHTASSGGAIGMFQHRQDRAKRMIQIAIENDKQWNDPNIQVMHLEEELNSAKGDQLGNAEGEGSFWESGKTLEQYVDIVNRKYMVSCRIVITPTGCSEPMPDPVGAGARSVKAAEEILENFSGYSGGSSSHTSSALNPCKTSSDGLDMSDMASLAISMSWPLGTPESQWKTDMYLRGVWSVPASCAGAKAKARPEFREGSAKRAERGLPGDTNDTGFADCGKFTSLVINLTADQSFPPGGTSIQRSYLDSSPKWELLSASSLSDLSPGDIMINPTHTFMYVGEVDGEAHVVAEASWCQYTARLRSARDGDLRSGNAWFRFTAEPVKLE